jgi:hypothetical protein
MRKIFINKELRFLSFWTCAQIRRGGPSLVSCISPLGSVIKEPKQHE